MNTTFYDFFNENNQHFQVNTMCKHMVVYPNGETACVDGVRIWRFLKENGYHTVSRNDLVHFEMYDSEKYLDLVNLDKAAEDAAKIEKKNHEALFKFNSYKFKCKCNGIRVIKTLDDFYTH